VSWCSEASERKKTPRRFTTRLRQLALTFIRITEKQTRKKTLHPGSDKTALHRKTKGIFLARPGTVVLKVTTDFHPIKSGAIKVEKRGKGKGKKS